MARLRRECPWDREQTHASLRRYLIEECHEVLGALDRGDDEELKEELGDLLFQVWFHTEVSSERDEGFDLADVLETVTEKLVRRHPHVYEERVVDAATTMRLTWEEIKRAEGRDRTLEGVPRTLPALLLAQVLQEKAASVGFDWPDVGGPLDKIREELDELDREVRAAHGGDGVPKPTWEMTHELGDLLFALVNTARHLGVNAEDALREASHRFRARFEHVEDAVRGRGEEMQELPLERLDELWDEAKEAGL